MPLILDHNPAPAYEIVKALIDAGTDIEARGSIDKTPFLKACSSGCLEILQLLVRRAGTSTLKRRRDKHYST